MANRRSKHYIANGFWHLRPRVVALCGASRLDAEFSAYEEIYTVGIPQAYWSEHRLANHGTIQAELPLPKG